MIHLTTIIAKTISFDTEKRIQALSSGDEISIVGIGKLSDFDSIKINTIQEYTILPNDILLFNPIFQSSSTYVDFLF